LPATQKAKIVSSGSRAVVSYNRKIINPVDDSVCRVTAGETMVIRRARGYVPDAVKLPFEVDGIFAAGADMKNVFAIGRDHRAILSQHNGDLDNYDGILPLQAEY
jgi:hydrogenase maturation protein HypF